MPRLQRHLPMLAAFALVLSVYVFFGSIGTLAFHRVRWDGSFGRPGEAYYASLGEGFLRGQLHMAHTPDPRLAALPHPYELKAREDAKIDYLWDASYLNGRYYLYFSPLPALLFYIPYRLVAGGWPHDQLAATVFAAWAFAMAAAFVMRALKIANRSLHVPLPVWIVTLGLSSIVPYVLPYSRTYEVAILCGAAMTSTWLFALLRFIESPTNRRLLAASIWLALAIAARPNLGVLLFVLLTAIVMVRKRNDLFKAALVAAPPLILAGAALLLYNYARFHDPFEFGHRYQLTYFAMAERRVCGVRSVAELFRLINSASLYTFTPPYCYGEFPFIDLRGGPLHHAVSFAAHSDQVGGLVPMAPLAAIGTLCAIVLALRRGEKDPGLRGALLAVAAGWLTLLGLSACWYVSARYEADFWFLISAGAIVCLEATFAALADSGVDMRSLRIAAIVVALLTSLAGAMLGFKATEGAFQYHNPELFNRLSQYFS